MAENDQKLFWNERISRWPYPKSMKAGAIAYAEQLIERDLPVIFEFRHLADLLDLKAQVLADMVNRPGNFYRSFDIPKRKGGVRRISVPSPSLLAAQRWLLKEIISKSEIHFAAHGFVNGRDIISNASRHLNRGNMIKLDLEDFFPSIKLNRVLAVFQGFGYPPNVSFYLARLCSFDGGLPQGGATSPFLSNIISKRMDRRIWGLCNSLGYVYTRYADDITISGEKLDLDLLPTLRKIISSEGFSINNKKTVFALNGMKKIVTGISVSNGVLRIPRAYKRAVRQDFHYVRKNGLFNQIEYLNNGDPLYLERLIGRLNFWARIEPENPFPVSALEILNSADQEII